MFLNLLQTGKVIVNIEYIDKSKCLRGENDGNKTR